MLSKGTNLILISMLIFAILNFIENLIHYNIGIGRYNNEFKFYFPNLSDFFKIVITMIIFALAQGLLTELIIKD